MSPIAASRSHNRAPLMALALVVAMLLVPGLVQAASLSGRVVGVSDGDTLTLLTASKTQVKVRLAAENMAVVRHIALNLLQSAKKCFKKDMSIRRLRKRAGWDGETLHTILTQPPI